MIVTFGLMHCCRRSWYLPLIAVTLSLVASAGWARLNFHTRATLAICFPMFAGEMASAKWKDVALGFVCGVVIPFALALFMSILLDRAGMSNRLTLMKCLSLMSFMAVVCACLAMTMY